MMPIPLFFKEQDNRSIILGTPTYSFTGTYSRDLTDYWKWRVTSETDTIINFEEFNFWQGGNLTSSVTSIDNLIGSRWEMSGGEEIFSVEFRCGIYTTYSSYNLYMLFDIESVNQTYIFCKVEIGDDTNYATFSANWFIDGNSVKFVEYPFNRPIKIIWNKNTSVSEIWSSTLWNSTSYNSLYGTYSFSTDKNPSTFVSFDGTFNQIKYGLSNYQPNGLTGSIFNTTENPPPKEIMMAQNDKY